VLESMQFVWLRGQGIFAAAVPASLCPSMMNNALIFAAVALLPIESTRPCPSSQPRRCFTCCRATDGRTPANFWDLHASVHRDLPDDGCYHCRHRQYRTAAAHVLLARANADAEEQEYTCSVVLCGRPSIREHSGAVADRYALNSESEVCVCG
jgi:hypothetical protein